MNIEKTVRKIRETSGDISRAHFVTRGYLTLTSWIEMKPNRFQLLKVICLIQLSVFN